MADIKENIKLRALGYYWVNFLKQTFTFNSTVNMYITTNAIF